MIFPFLVLLLVVGLFLGRHSLMVDLIVWNFFIFVQKVLIQKPLILAFGAKTEKYNILFQILEPAICVFVNPPTVYSGYCILM